MNAPLPAVASLPAGPWVRTIGALAILAGGALHVRLAFDEYGTDDLITLFFLNGIGSALIAAWVVYDRRPFALLAGLGLSTVSLAALGLSRVGDGVVGFRGVGLDPAPDVALTVVAEATAIVLLLAGLFGARRELVAIYRQLRHSSTRRL